MTRARQNRGKKRMLEKELQQKNAGSASKKLKTDTGSKHQSSVASKSKKPSPSPSSSNDNNKNNKSNKKNAKMPPKQKTKVVPVKEAKTQLSSNWQALIAQRPSNKPKSSNGNNEKSKNKINSKNNKKNNNNNNNNNTANGFDRRRKTNINNNNNEVQKEGVVDPSAIFRRDTLEKTTQQQQEQKERRRLEKIAKRTGVPIEEQGQGEEGDNDGITTAPVTSVISRNTNLPSAITASADTRIVALDCEMVGVGLTGKRSALARVSLVDGAGAVILDSYVKPQEEVTDYRTRWSGIRPRNLVHAPSFSAIQARVAKLLEGKVLVGHALKNDLDALMLTHPRHLIRDTAHYRPLKKSSRRSASLKVLTAVHLNEDIQGGEHSSVVDARAALGVYLKHRENWERDMYGKVEGAKNIIAKRQSHWAKKEKKIDAKDATKK